MIALLVERMPQVVVPHNKLTGKKIDSKNANDENNYQQSDTKTDS